MGGEGNLGTDANINLLSDQFQNQVNISEEQTVHSINSEMNSDSNQPDFSGAGAPDSNSHSNSNSNTNLNSGSNSNIDSSQQNANSSQASSSSQNQPDTSYQLKTIQWKSKPLKIITQNNNGPCPLLAICNCLLLRGDITIHTHLTVVTYEHLVSLIGDLILKSLPNNASDEVRLNHQQNLGDAISIMQKLQTGLDVNVGFSRPTDFEYSPDCLIFDLLDIKLVHGWLADPANQDGYEFLCSTRYNQLVEKIINSKTPDPKLSDDENTKIFHEGLVGEHFLQETASQLTYQGIMELHHTLKDNEIVVFFRNNHFSTLYKREHEIFLLLTDQGFKNESAVWEVLSTVQGDNTFVTSEFTNYVPKPEPLRLPIQPQEHGSTLNPEMDEDMALALKILQEEEDKEMARRLQESFNLQDNVQRQRNNQNQTQSQNFQQRQQHQNQQQQQHYQQQQQRQNNNSQPNRNLPPQAVANNQKDSSCSLM